MDWLQQRRCCCRGDQSAGYKTTDIRYWPLSDLFMMNETQRTIRAIAAVAMLLAVLFFVPWRIESSGELKWAPLFRPPVSHSLTYETERPGSRYTYDEAEVALEIYFLEILVIGLIGWATFVISSGATREETE